MAPLPPGYDYASNELWEYFRITRSG